MKLKNGKLPLSPHERQTKARANIEEHREFVWASIALLMGPITLCGMVLTVVLTAKLLAWM